MTTTSSCGCAHAVRSGGGFETQFKKGGQDYLSHLINLAIPIGFTIASRVFVKKEQENKTGGSLIESNLESLSNKISHILNKNEYFKSP